MRAWDCDVGGREAVTWPCLRGCGSIVGSSSGFVLEGNGVLSWECVVGLAVGCFGYW